MNDETPIGQAPYRFVPMNAAVVKTQLDDNQLKNAHDMPIEGGLSATLEVQWAAETPFLIGDTRAKGQGDRPDEIGPLKIGGDYAIPGASLRGMLRSVMEIACFARLRQINEHHRYAIRDFQHPYYRSSLLDQKSVKAGWMRRERDSGQTRWVIRPCDWKPVSIESLLSDLGGAGTEAWLKSDRCKKYQRFNGAVTVGPNPGSAKEESFTVDWSKTLRPVRMGDKGRMSVGGAEGERYIVASGAAVNTRGRFAKKVEYAFTAGEPDQEVEIHPEAWRSFETVHCKPSRNKPEPDGAWAEWVGQAEAGLWIPVFYTGEPGDAGQAIGLTRLFRMPASNSVGDVRDKAIEHRRMADEKLDMVEALFGYVDEAADRGEGSEAGALRSRIRFGFARLLNPEVAEETEAMDAVMMGPRASFGPFYLLRDPDWSGDPLLAGRKRYPVRYADDRANALQDIRERFANTTVDAEGKAITETSRSNLRYLFATSGELIFQSEVRLHNVTPEELGAVIWALKLGDIEKKTRRHALGRGKAFGCGQIRVRGIGLRVRLNTADMPGAEEMLLSARRSDRSAEGEHWMLPREPGAPDWVSTSAFQTRFTRHMGASVDEWGKSPQIQALLASTNPVRGEKLRREDKLSYLGETGLSKKQQDGHRAHMDLKKRGQVVRLPWS